MNELCNILETIRVKRCEINLLINKELNIKNGAENMFNVLENEQSKEKLKLEIIFSKSNMRYLKDKLAELNCYLTLKSLNEKNSKDPKYNLDFIMIYLMPKETINDIDFKLAFDNFILEHYKESPLKYSDQIQSFTNYRKAIIKKSQIPNLNHINSQFEYINSLDLIEKRFFKNFECNYVYFKWFDNLSGIQSMQKSIQFEKACILFNCASLYNQMTELGKLNHEEQILNWQRAAGCLTFLSINYSFYSPSLDMSSIFLNVYAEIFICQAYELKSKILLNILNKCNDLKLKFSGYINCSKIFAWISKKYNQILFKLNDNSTIKNHLPEIWFYLIKVKSNFYNGLAHYFASFAIKYVNLSDQRLDFVQEMNIVLKDFYSKKFNDDLLNKIVHESNESFRLNKSFLKLKLAIYHMKKSLISLEEAIRHHGFCRKFSKDDNLYTVLKNSYFRSFEKQTNLKEEIQNLTKYQIKDDIYNENLLEILCLNTSIPDSLRIKPIIPVLKDYVSKDFFEKIGPIRLYSSENNLSVPFTCILIKQNNTFGLTVKGDCPVRINQLDPNLNIKVKNINEGDYIVEIDGEDVKWLKHNQIVEKFRSKTMVKLTLVRARPIKNDTSFIINEYMKRIMNRNGNKHSANNFPSYLTGKIKYSTNYIQPFIRFNEEDDEINIRSASKTNKHKNNNLNNFLKDFKLATFAHTITFGRKFKKLISINKLDQIY